MSLLVSDMCTHKCDIQNHISSRAQAHAVSQHHTQIDLGGDILDDPELLTCLFNLQSNLLCLVQCVW